jgi:hypothetical protein
MTKNHDLALKPRTFGAYPLSSLAKVPYFHHRDRGPSL